MAVFEPIFAHCVPSLKRLVIRGKGAKKKMKIISFISKNVCGIKSVNRLEEIFYVLSQRKNVAVVRLEENW